MWINLPSFRRAAFVCVCVCVVLDKYSICIATIILHQSICENATKRNKHILKTFNVFGILEVT